ncbi:MAG: EamA family transporter [Patescibacteria group bacterium]
MSWIIFAILSAIFAALVAIFGKIGIQNIDSVLGTTLRSFVMFSFLAATSIFLGKANLFSTIDKKALFYIILSGVAGAISWLFYFFALKGGPVSSVAAIDRLSVVFVVILAFLFLGEKLTGQSILGAALLIIGAILLTLK